MHYLASFKKEKKSWSWEDDHNENEQIKSFVKH